MGAETEAGGNVRIPRSQRRGLRRKKDRGSIQRNDSGTSISSISNESQHRRQRSNNSADLSAMVRRGSSLVPGVAEPGRRASSRSVKRQGTNDSIQSATSAESQYRRQMSYARNNSNNSLGSLLERGSIVVPPKEEPCSNLNAGLRRNVSDLSLHSLAAGDPSLCRVDTMESFQEEDKHQNNIGISFDLDEEEEEEEEEEDTKQGSVFMSLQDMAAEANAVTMDSSCWSTSEYRGVRTRTATAAATTLNTNRTEMEVSPGVYLPFRDAKETWKAVAKGRTLRCCCLECGIELVAIQDCECVVCPDCQMLNPVFERPAGVTTVPVGIGLGLKLELVDQKMAQKMATRSGRKSKGVPP